jgi:hypothetical protein
MATEQIGRETKTLTSLIHLVINTNEEQENYLRKKKKKTTFVS